jgi:dipeptidyl aminopeptidase/acylaminoacyl peptidase
MKNVWLPLLLILAILVACDKDAEGPLQPSNFSGHFTFIHPRNTDAEVVDEIMVMDNSGIRQTTSSSAPETFKADPFWLGEGQWVCFRTRDTCYCPAEAEFALVHVGDGQIVILPEAIRHGTSIRFSPSAKYAVVEGNWEIRLFALDQQMQPTPLATWPAYPLARLDWSKNAESLLFTAINPASDAVLALLHPESLTLVELYTFGTFGTSGDYGISPDGVTVALIHDEDLHILDPDGVTHVRYDTPDFDERQLAWSPDNKKLLITRRARNSFADELVVFDPGQESGQVILPADTLNGWITQIQWSRDGEEIAFTLTGSHQYGMYIISADGTGLRKILDQVVPAFDWY